MSTCFYFILGETPATIINQWLNNSEIQELISHFKAYYWEDSWFIVLREATTRIFSKFTQAKKEVFVEYLLKQLEHEFIHLESLDFEGGLGDYIGELVLRLRLYEDQNFSTKLLELTLHNEAQLNAVSKSISSLKKSKVKNSSQLNQLNYEESTRIALKDTLLDILSLFDSQFLEFYKGPLLQWEKEAPLEDKYFHTRITHVFSDKKDLHSKVFNQHLNLLDNLKESSVNLGELKQKILDLAVNANKLGQCFTSADRSEKERVAQLILKVIQTIKEATLIFRSSEKFNGLVLHLIATGFIQLSNYHYLQEMIELTAEVWEGINDPGEIILKEQSIIDQYIEEAWLKVKSNPDDPDLQYWLITTLVSVKDGSEWFSQNKHEYWPFLEKFFQNNHSEFEAVSDLNYPDEYKVNKDKESSKFNLFAEHLESCAHRTGEGKFLCERFITSDLGRLTFVRVNIVPGILHYGVPFFEKSIWQYIHSLILKEGLVKKIFDLLANREIYYFESNLGLLEKTYELLDHKIQKEIETPDYNERYPHGFLDVFDILESTYYALTLLKSSHNSSGYNKLKEYIHNILFHEVVMKEWNNINILKELQVQNHLLAPLMSICYVKTNDTYNLHDFIDIILSDLAHGRKALTELTRMWSADELTSLEEAIGSDHMEMINRLGRQSHRWEVKNSLELEKSLLDC